MRREGYCCCKSSLRTELPALARSWILQALSSFWHCRIKSSPNPFAGISATVFGLFFRPARSMHENFTFNILRLQGKSLIIN